MKSGPPKVVSHHNKATKGRILRAIAQSKTKVKTIDDLAQIIRMLGADVALNAPDKAGAVVLEVVVEVL
jgi:cytoplasmic iron level regulating protein YaaA (DUF328/UPF0246 family)